LTTTELTNDDLDEDYFSCDSTLNRRSPQMVKRRNSQPDLGELGAVGRHL